MFRSWSLFVFALSVVMMVDANQAAADVETLRSQLLADFPDHEVQMLTVSYEPGESSPPHRHNAHVFVYVLEGQVEMQVDGGNPVLLEAGDTFYETPDDVHRVSRNLSDSKGAKFLVFMIKTAGAPATEALKP